MTNYQLEKIAMMRQRKEEMAMLFQKTVKIKEVQKGPRQPTLPFSFG